MVKKQVQVKKSTDGKKQHVRTIEVPDIAVASAAERAVLKVQLQEIQKELAIAENEGFVSDYAKAAWGNLLKVGSPVYVPSGGISEAFSFYGGSEHTTESVEVAKRFAEVLEADQIDWSTASDPFAANDFHTYASFAGTFVDYNDRVKVMFGTVESFDGEVFNLFTEVDDDIGFGSLIDSLVKSSDTPFEEHKERFMERFTAGWFEYI